MQGTRADRWKRIVKIALPLVVLCLCVLFDQLTKVHFKKTLSDGGDVSIIPNFFYFTYTVNTGAAWSFLADVSWGQIFFKILTGVSLILFGFLMFYAYKKDYKWLTYSVALIIGGTIGNFIDRLFFNGVTDFIGFIFGDYHFPIFNLADTFLVVGVIMALIHFLFLDNNKMFKKSDKKSKVDEEDGNKEVSDNQ